MPTPFEIAQAMALQQVQKRKTMADAELANIEARYKPANYAAENALKQAKTSLIPYEMANYQSLVGYRNMLNQYMPTDYAIKAGNLRARQEQLDFDKRNYGSTFGKALNDFERIKQAYGENSPQAKSFQDYIDKEAAGSQGVQVFGANGNPLVQIGGSSRGNKSGGTYLDPKTGQIVSRPTGAVSTLAQNAILGEKKANRLLNKIIEGQKQYTGAVGKGERLYDIAYSELFQKDNPRLEKHNIGKSLEKASPEALLRTWGIPVTEYGSKMIEKAIQPMPGDTPGSVERRLGEVKDLLQENAENSAEALANGITVRGGWVQQPETSAPNYSAADTEAELKRRGLIP